MIVPVDVIGMSLSEVVVLKGLERLACPALVVPFIGTAHLSDLSSFHLSICAVSPESLDSSDLSGRPIVTASDSRDFSVSGHGWDIVSVGLLRYNRRVLHLRMELRLVNAIEGDVNLRLTSVRLNINVVRSDLYGENRHNSGRKQFHF